MADAGTVLVTGASSGIGLAVRDKLLATGYDVVGVSRNPGASRELDGYTPVPCDFLQLDSIAETLHGAMSKIDNLVAVVSNAGIPAVGNLEQWSIAEIRRSIEINLTSHILVAKALLPVLKKRNQGRLIFMGSEAALQGAKYGSVYCAAKFGLRGFAQSLRQECASSGVGVSIIHPGMVRTPFFDHLSFKPGDDADNVVELSAVSDAVCSIIQTAPGTVIDEISISPLKKVVQRKK